jgi:hypothetical protein
MGDYADLLNRLNRMASFVDHCWVDTITEAADAIATLTREFAEQRDWSRNLEVRAKELAAERDAAKALSGVAEAIASRDAAIARAESAERKLAMAAGVLRNFEVTKPDGDGFVWLVFHGNGTTGKGMVNLGAEKHIVAQVALNLECDRIAAIAELEKADD